VHRWLESKGRLQRDVHGQPRRLIGVTWGRERAAPEREERLLGIANLVPGMVYQLQRKPDGQYTLTYVSEGIRGLCGLDAESARADAVSFLRHIHRDERERFLASSEASAAALSPWHEEFRMLDADGAQRWVEGHALPQRMPDGTVLWHGHIFDITERKAIESDLRETKGNLTMALAAARMVTWRWDLDSNAISSPQDLGEFFDLPRQDPTMEDILGNIHPDDRPHIDNAIRQAISQPSAETVRLEFRVPRANEKFHLLEVRARAEFDADGRLRGFRGVTVDLTDQRLGDQERSALQDQLQQAQKMELLGLMTGGIAHDFNNILASILGYAGLAARDASATLGERQAGYLEQIRVAAERGAELITQMLAFSRGETAARSPQALSALVQLAVKMLRPTFPSSIEIRTELDAALPPVVTTAVEIQQIVLNLCINARDAMPATGTIALSLAARKDCQEQCASCGGGIDGDFVVLTVADNGAGIPEDVCRRIFEPLFSTKSVGRGTGLGLAMVHGIVHRNHGHISVATAAGQGTRFDIFLPAASTPAKATSPSNADKDGAPSTRASARRAHPGGR
jgi:PAS domain S-box-containing protein